LATALVQEKTKDSTAKFQSEKTIEYSAQGQEPSVPVAATCAAEPRTQKAIRKMRWLV